MSKTTIHHKLRDEYPKALLTDPPDAAYTIDPQQDPTIFSVDAISNTNKKPKITGKRCDDFVVLDLDMQYNKTGIYVIERTGITKNISTIQQQLQGGVRFIENFIEHHRELSPLPFIFIPIFVSKTGRIANPFMRKLLLKKITSRRSATKHIVHVLPNRPLPDMPNE